MNYEVNCRSYLGSSFPIHRLRRKLSPGKRANVRCGFFSVKRLFDTRSVCLAGNAAPAAVWCAVLLFSGATAAQSPADNWARCEGSDPDASIAACTALIESGKEDNENQAVAFNSRGIAYSMKNQQDQAIADFNQAIQLEPDYAGAFSNRANAYAARGEFDRAMADYNRAIQLKPDDGDAYNYRGVAYAVMGQFDKAIADFDRAIQLKPENAGALNNRGSAYDSMGEYERAIADFDKAIELKPDDAEAYSNRGNAYTDEHQYDKAIADYTQALRLNPGDCRDLLQPRHPVPGEREVGRGHRRL